MADRADVEKAPWGGVKPHKFLKVARRTRNHFLRPQAPMALFLAASAALLAAVIGPSSPSGQVLLVIVGLLISFVLLPEQPHRLWNVDAKVLADTVPNDKLVDASKQLALALGLQVDGPVDSVLLEQLWKTGLDGIDTAVVDASRLVLDVDYRIRLSGEQGGPRLVVDSCITSRRCVPLSTDDEMWVSFCADSAALDREFVLHSQGCLARELVPRFEGEDLRGWFRRVMTYPAHLVVDGQRLEALRREAPEEFRDNPDVAADVLRVAFSVPGLRQRFLPVEVHMGYEVPADQRTFPVKFAAYTVLGATRITFELEVPESALSVDDYLSASTRSVDMFMRGSPGEMVCEARAPSGTVLPIGSGIVFSWKNVSSDATAAAGSV